MLYKTEIGDDYERVKKNQNFNFSVTKFMSAVNAQRGELGSKNIIQGIWEISLFQTIVIIRSWLQKLLSL